ncbi:hypothetical protein [Vagococcus fluvialis]|uniref:Uncharacterized protein n=1 Tax=Vagococcus fluvialis TaxID=2738 RepID=A0A7X6I3S6_9ENTE|nr:hypothetical protein [Vagococcus fluvialis]NKC68861.1 hypothetical protein [Vagococcus fluvialis]
MSKRESNPVVKSKLKKYYIGLVFLSVLIVTFSGEDKETSNSSNLNSEVVFFENAIEVQNDVVSYIANQDVYADDARQQTIKFLDESIGKLKEKKPARNLPSEVKKGYKKHRDGLTKIRKGYSSNKIELAEEGGNDIREAREAYEKYLLENPEIEEELSVSFVW